MSSITTINAIVKKIFWSDTHTGQSGIILESMDEHSKSIIMEKKNRDEITAVGTIFSPKVGDKVTCEGFFINHAQYGTQFKARVILPYDSLRVQFPLESIRTSIFNDISRFNKEKIIKAYGENSLNMIFSKPQELLDREMLKKSEFNSLVTKRNDIYAHYRSYCLLRGFKISSLQAESILDQFNTSTKLKTSQNPYEYLNVRGVGVAACDKIAFGIGVDKKSDLRVKSSIIDFAENSIKRGNSGFSMSEMVDTLSVKLNLTKDFIHSKFMEIADSGTYNAPQGNEDIVYIYQLAIEEKNCAIQLKRLSSSPFKSGLGTIEELPDFLNKAQIDGIYNSVYSKVSIITGGPGVGKTTVVKNVTDEIEKVSGSSHKILMVAPTGRAARRMSESTGKDADTIHSVLEYIGDGNYARDEKNALICDTVIVDESSMVDINLFSALLRAIPSHARLVIVGDEDQLSSVGPGSVLKDLISSGVITKTVLNEPMRFAETSMINKNARKINAGEMPDLGQTSDFGFFECNGAENSSEFIQRIVKTLNSKNKVPFKDIQILTPMTNHATGIKNMNEILRDIMNPIESSLSIRAYGIEFRINDRVMQTENNKEKEINNGDIGYITEINTEDGSVTIDFEGRNVVLTIPEMRNLMFAYAMTIHKSQGSEFPYVIMPISEEHKRMLTKEIVYTGVTRGKKGVFLVGNKNSLQEAVENKNSEVRVTSFSYFLRKEFAGSSPENDNYIAKNDLHFDDRFLSI